MGSTFASLRLSLALCLYGNALQQAIDVRFRTDPYGPTSYARDLNSPQITESHMPLAHAVAWIDHHKAHVLQFDANQVLDEKIHEQSHYTRQHGSSVRSEHEFFGEVCDALAGIEAVLVVGGHTAQADFRHYVDKHRSHLAALIVGWETVDNPTEGQVVKLARQFFVRRCEMVPTPRTY